MTFIKHAKAQVIHAGWNLDRWGNFIGDNRQKLASGSQRTAASSPNLIQQASEILQEDFDPDKYLLTHSTIVASVDTQEVPNVKLGAIQEEGRNINRKWSNYRITPETSGWINNNNDSWSRPVLLKSYRTFIGGMNFVEHVQLAELAKGRIIDAVARDIGPSVYVDILTATNRKHAELIRDINEGRMSTLSMGCFLAGTQVTMGDGTRVAIEEVVPGDMVLTHKGRVREVLNKQIRTYQGELRYIKAVGVSSTIRATANHGFHVLRAQVLAEARQHATESPTDLPFEKVRADDLVVGDFLVCPHSVEGFSPLEMLEENFVVDDYVVFPITSIETDWYEGIVHNMEVDEDHTYVVEGVTAYNCSVVDCVCTKCGNVASDESQMCDHIKYAKGNTFFDEYGQRHQVAELCGHQSIDPTGGVHFIEASWVATPAFTGAVLRNILEPDVVNLQTKETVRQMLASPPAQWTSNNPDERKKAARVGFEFGDESENTEAAPAAPSNPLDGLEGEVEQYILDNVKKRIKDKLQQKVQEEAASSPGELATSTGNQIIHQGSALTKQAAEYQAGVAALVKIARSDVELIDLVARLNQRLGLKVSREIYVTSLRVGSTAGHDNLGSYLTICSKVLNRKPTLGEAKTLVRLGQILSSRK